MLLIFTFYFVFVKKYLTPVTQIPVRTKLSAKNCQMESMTVSVLLEQVANTVKVRNTSRDFPVTTCDLMQCNLTTSDVNIFLEKDPCIPSPCKNNGKCVETRDGGFRCVCENGYTGENCELRK